MHYPALHLNESKTPTPQTNEEYVHIKASSSDIREKQHSVIPQEAAKDLSKLRFQIQFLEHKARDLERSIDASEDN